MDAGRMLGGWDLLEWRIDYGDGRPASFPFGTDATGMLLYTQDGCMSAGISRRARASLGGSSVRHATVEQRATAFDSHFHYHGTWTLNGEQVVHSVLGSLNPDFVGTSQIRAARIAGDVLELSAEDLVPGTGVRRRHVLRWRRRAPAA
jgi:hypothetical protein